MITILDLWLPIVLSAVFVFIVSSILHMVLTYHRADYKKLPDEAATLAALRQTAPGARPGLYFFPHAPSMKEAGSPEMKEKFRQGPVGMLILRPTGEANLGSSLGAWFGYLLLVSVFAAYLAGRTMAPGIHYLAVFRVVGTTAFMAYGIGQLVDSIWRGMPWSNTLRAVADGLLYSLVTAGTFGWLWPR